VTGFPGALRLPPATRWTAERFGLTPRKLRARVANDRMPTVLCVSMPKAGTHLLERAVCLHPRLYRKLLPTLTQERADRRGGLETLLSRLRPGEVLVAHLPFRPPYPAAIERAGARAIFVTRDPRDVAVSLAHYIAGRPENPYHEAFAERSDLHSRLELAIAGDPTTGVASMEGLLSDFAGWLDGPAAVVRFEDLVGQSGGGNADAQRRALEAIYGHLGLDISERLVGSVAGRLFSSESPTFRRGSIGQWQECFDSELDALLEATAGDWLRVYGYA
jgi:hypothetical protein